MNDTVARFVDETEFESLPDDVVAQAKLVFLDTVGVILAGSGSSEATALARLVTTNTTAGSSTLLRTGFPRSDSATAAFVNGTTAVFLEMDEGHRFFTTHAAVHILPAALAVSEETNASGRDLLTALVVGYDVAARTGGATRARPMVNGHGTWGAVGAAAAAAKLMKAGPKVIGRALGIGAHLALATSNRAPLEGATVRNAYVGLAGQAGVRAAQLAQSGFTPLPDASAEVFGRILGNNFDPSVVTDELGTRYEITRNFFKLYACCQWNHATLDALEDLLRNQPLSDAEIDSIQVSTFLPASNMNAPEPVNSLQAKFSIPYAVAARIVLGHAGPDAFTPEAISDRRIIALARRVEVIADDAMTSGFPVQRSAAIRVQKRDGNKIESFCENARGDFLRPHSRASLVQKFRTLAGTVLADHSVDSLEHSIDDLESVENIRDLVQSLQSTAAAKERVQA